MQDLPILFKILGCAGVYLVGCGEMIKIDFRDMECAYLNVPDQANFATSTLLGLKLGCDARRAVVVKEFNLWACQIIPQCSEDASALGKSLFDQALRKIQSIVLF